MKRRMIALGAAALLSITFTGCMGTYYETNAKTYQEALKYIGSPEFFPEKIDGFEVKGYSYTRYEYMDTCVELFVELTVDAAQMESLLSAARGAGTVLVERDAYYAKGYAEIVFADSYRVQDSSANVGNAYVQKVIYNIQTGNIIYEHFDAFDSGVYEIKDVAYFVRFGIDQTEYVEYTFDEN